MIPGPHPGFAHRKAATSVPRRSTRSGRGKTRTHSPRRCACDHVIEGTHMPALLKFDLRFGTMVLLYFIAVCAVLAFAVGATIYHIAGVSERVNRPVTLRAPVSN